MPAFLPASVIFFIILGTGLLPLIWNWQSKHLDVFGAFGAGVLLAAAFVHMLPEANQAMGEISGFYVLAGFLFIYFIEDFLMAHSHGGEPCPNHKIGWSALIGLSAHSIVAGVALGVGLQESNSTMLSSALLAAIAIHKVPETLALMALILNSGWNKRAALIALVFFALMGPSGVIFSFLPWISSEFAQSQKFFGAALALSAGTFVFIASSDLLPSLHRHGSHKYLNLLAFLLGILLLSLHL